MVILRKIVMGVTAIAALALMISLTAPRTVQAVDDKFVTVTNTPDVHVTNTPTVNVGNTVPVTGTVAVSSKQHAASHAGRIDCGCQLNLVPGICGCR